MEGDVVDSEFCSSCKKYVIAANFTSHSAFCQRNVKACNVCGEQIFKDLIKEHEEKYHISVVCDICSATVEKWMLPKHQEECNMRLIFCEFCSSNFPFNTFAEHIDFCESRTEKCPLCSKYIMLKDKKKHSEFHQHEENILKKDTDREADQNSVSNLVEQEFKKIQRNYLPKHFGGHAGSSMSGGTSLLPRHFTHYPGSTMPRGTSQDHLDNSGNYYDLQPFSGASNFFATPPFGPPYAMNSKQVNPSLASAFSTPLLVARKSITNPLTSSYSFEKGNVKFLPKHFSHSLSASISKGNIQNNPSNNKKFYHHPALSGGNDLYRPQPFYPPYGMNSKQVNPALASVSSDQSTVKALNLHNRSTGEFIFKMTNEKTLATNEKLPEQGGQAANMNPTFPLLPSEPESDSAESYFQCHLCCENVLQKDRDMHLSSTCIMLQEDIPAVPYTCPLCNKIMPEKDKTIHELFECNVLIEANEQSSDSEDEIHFLGMTSHGNAKTTPQKNILENHPSDMMANYSGNVLNLMSTASAMKACARKAMLKKLQEGKNESKILSKEAKESCPTCNKFIRLLDYHLHVPFCANIPRRASSRQVTTQNLQKNKSEADLKARAKYEQTLKSLTTNFCNEQKKVETSRNEKKHGSDPNEGGNALRAKQPCKMKLGNYPIFNFDKLTPNSFGSLASQSTSSERAEPACHPTSLLPGPYPILNFGGQTSNSFGSSMASPSTSRGITHGKETSTLSDKNSEAKGSSDDDGLWSSEVKLPKCIICIMNERSIVFQPCGHLVVCSSCANIKMVDCPVCRKRIKGKLKTYIS